MEDLGDTGSFGDMDNLGELEEHHGEPWGDTRALGDTGGHRESWGPWKTLGDTGWPQGYGEPWRT